MHAALSLALFVVVGVELASAGGGSWSYDDSHGTGPANWNKDFPSCGGTKQSPIDIVARSADYNSFGRIEFHGYENVTASSRYTVVNNGHTVQLQGITNEMFITGGGLPNDRYRLAQFHVHWGAENNVGSEHTVNGKYYPLEIHLVHYNAERSDINDAVTNGGDGALAVLGIFAEVGPKRHETLQNFIESFDRVKDAETTTQIRAFALRDLLPANTQDFIRYDGSLTTPGCSEIVTWTVFKQPITISQAQLNQFRTLNHNKPGMHQEALVNNYRPVQPVGNRRVKRSYDADNVGGDGHRHLAAISLLFGMALGVTGTLLRQ